MENQQVYNNLGSLVDSLSFGTPFYSEQISQVDTLFNNNRWYMLSNMRQILSQLYVEHGIVQTMIDVPVDDAFRSGYEIKSQQLSPEEIIQLTRWCELNDFDSIFSQSVKWNRLFGGGGIVIITDQDPSTPLEPLEEDAPLEFRAVDLWELFYNKQNTDSDYNAVDFGIDTNQKDFMFDYYGKKLHPSRVYLLKGKEPPSFIRPRLRGWGMSELERLVRSFNSYIKNQDLVFELLDEAKVDVYHMTNFNSTMLTKNGTNKIRQQIQESNMVKNFHNAIVMDKNDEYEQKQIAFTGLGEMLVQIRQAVASDLRMPMTKLFGISSAGFNSGEDDIENYNGMVEGEVRNKVKNHIVQGLELVCEKLFGYKPDDLEIVFRPLRILGADAEESVKEKRSNRVIALFSSGLISAEEAKQSINKDNLIAIKVEENDEIYDNPTGVAEKATGVNIEPKTAENSLFKRIIARLK